METNEKENKLETTFFGTGNYARLVMGGLEYASRRDQVRLKNVVARNLEKLRQFANEFGFEDISNEGDKMLESPGDFKIIITPAPTHADFVRRANAPLIWLEKPIAENFTEAKYLLHELEKQGKVVALDYTFNNDLALLRLAEMIRDGETGKINSVHAHFLRASFADMQEEFPEADKYKRASLDLLPHIVAGFNLMGLKIAEVRNKSLVPPERFTKEPWNDGGVVEIKLRDKDGSIINGKVDISMARKEGEKIHSNGFEIYSEKGKWFWRYDVKENIPGGGKSVLLHNPDVRFDSDDIGRGEQIVMKGNNRSEMLGRQWDKVIGLIGKSREEALKILGPSSDSKAAEDMKIVEAVEQSAKTENRSKWIKAANS